MKPARHISPSLLGFCRETLPPGQRSNGEWRVVGRNAGGQGTARSSTYFLPPTRPPPPAVQRKAVRERWTGDREYFLSPTGSDSNTGRSKSSPWATPIFAHETLLWNHDLAGYAATIRFAPGVYQGERGQLKAWGPLVGQGAVEDYAWSGVAGNPGAVKLNGFGFHAHDFAKFLVTDVEISTSETACLGSFSGILKFARVRFSDVGRCFHLWSRERGIIDAAGDYTIAGSASCHAYAFNRGSIMLPAKITIAPEVAFDLAFAVTQSGGVDLSGARLAGSFDGQCYRCADNGSVRTGTGDPNFIPGTIPGVTTIGGVISGFYS